jgi:hypothetical protein
VDNDAATEEQARQFLEEFAAVAQPLEAEFLREIFHFYSEGEPGQVLELSWRLEEMYSGRRSFGSLTRWVDQLREPLLRRRVASLRQRFLDFQGDRELRKKLLGAVEEYLNADGAAALEMPELPEGRRPAIPYRHPTDCGDGGWDFVRGPSRAAREAVFRERHAASPQTAALLSEVFALRARLVEERLSEGAVEFDPEQHILQEVEAVVPVQELLSELRRATDPLYTELLDRKRRKLGTAVLCWWDVLAEPEDLLEELEDLVPPDRAVELASQTLAEIGFSPEALGIALVRDPRPHRRRHAYRFPLRVPGDVRLLVRAGAGLRAAELLLHEMGHALYTSQVEQEVWEFRGPAATCFTEAAGQFLARLCRSKEWLTGTAGLEPARVERCRRLHAEQDLIRLRMALLLARFEAEARAQGPEALEQMWVQLAAEELGVQTEPGLMVWAAIWHFALIPGHMQALVLAELIAAQLADHYTRQLGTLVGNDALGRRLARDIFRHGARYPWPQLLLKITGRQLGVEPLVRELQEARRDAD